MPKVIQPRRHDKDLSAEQFWKIRELGKVQSTQTGAAQAFREEEVSQRNRYQKPSEKAKVFNPLALMLRRENRSENNELYTIGDDDQNTCVNEFLQGVLYTVSVSVKDIKHLVMGRKSIIYNIEKIYDLLWRNLESEEAWPLLQAIIKDVRGQRFDLWLQLGFKRLAEYTSEIASNNFNEIYFRNLFNTLCIIMEHFYVQITGNLQAFLLEYGACFFKHQNKYIRKFSVQSFSYILSNLSAEEYHEFMNFLVEQQNKGFFDSHVKLADLLLQRLRIVRGGLTTASVTHFLDQIETLANIFFEQSEASSQVFDQLASDYISLVVTSLNNKQNGSDEQIIFDFNYILRALVNFSKNNVQRYTPSLVLGFSKFLSQFRADRKRFTANTNFQINYMGEMWQIFADFYKSNVAFFKESSHLNDAIAVLVLKCSSTMYYDSEIINYCTAHNQVVEVIIKVVYETGSEIEKGLIEIILLLSRDFLTKFILEDQNTELIYSLIILLKRAGLSKQIEATWLNIDSQQILAKLKRAKLEDDLIVILRLITYIKFDASQQFCNQIVEIQQLNLGQYESYMKQALETSNKKNMLNHSEYFNTNNYISEIILYSHHQIKWLSHIFNLYEAFSLALQQLTLVSGTELKKTSLTVWNQLIISRPSAIDILRSNGYLNECLSNNSLILHLLSSRNRQVRHSSLQVIHQQLDEKTNGFEVQIITKLLQIDEKQIDLDNEREVKRIFCILEQEMENFSTVLTGQRAQNFLKCLIQWAIGFAFTGFKLIEKSFITFFSSLIDIPLVGSSNESIVSSQLMPFLEYYNYRHSRSYEHDLSSEASTSHLANAFEINRNEALIPYIKEDFELSDLETVEWIGLERISQSIKVSKKGKNNLGHRLEELVNAYFEFEFKRQKVSIQNYEQSKQIPKAFLKPIKQRFLITILKLCPTNFLPPFECLQYTREEYFQIPSVRAIKKNNWQAMWEKKKSDQPKKKVQISESVSTTVNLEHLGPQQQEMYLNYLWKDILQSNRHKKRIIMDHIRNYLPTAADRLIKLLFENLHLSDLDFLHSNEQTVSTIVERLKLLNRKVLLNQMFILKSILLHLRQEVNSSYNLKAILMFILALIQIVYDYSNTAASLDHQQDVDDKEEDVLSEDNQEEEETGKSFEYKQHRKELQKVLQTLFANHQLEPETITELLQFLLANTKINLSKATRLSLPGLLLIIKIVSAQKEYCVVLTRVMNGQIPKLLGEMIHADEEGAKPMKSCIQIWLNIMENLVLPERQLKMTDNSNQYQSQIDQILTQHTQTLIPSILSYLNSFENKYEKKNNKFAPTGNNKRKQSPDGVRLLKIIEKLMVLHSSEIDSGWERYIWEQLSKITKIKKNLTSSHCERLSLLIVILTRYIHLKPEGLQGESRNFLRRIIGVLPNIKDSDQRLKINSLMVNSHKQLGLSEEVVNLVAKLGKIKKDGLIITIDFSSFFDSCNEYAAKIGELKLIDHEYFLNNLLCYLDNDQLSVRRAVSSSNKVFLQEMQTRIKGEAMIDEDNQEKKSVLVLLVVKVYRVLLDMLPKQTSQQNESIFWNIVDSIGVFFNWISQLSAEISAIYTKSNARYYSIVNHPSEQEENYFKQLGSLSQANKLKGIRTIKSILEGLVGEDREGLINWDTNTDIDIPNPLVKVILPILEYLIMTPTENNHNSKNTLKGNLSSTLSLVSLQILPSVSSLIKESLIKKQLKRLVAKLKFNEAEGKKNMAIVRMMSQIIDGVPGERVNQKMKSYIEEHGFDKFHNKITQATRQAVHEHYSIGQSDNDDEEEQGTGKREKIPGFFEKLEELESEQAINRNFLSFDKKMMDIEDEADDSAFKMEFPNFLRKQILLPLRAMLMIESKAKGQQDKVKGRVLLAVTVTKVLLRLPMDVFLREFQKVIGRLGRLLKKKITQVRENARSCLCEIAKSVGSQLLYAIILELKFHLRDNFDRHVFNYSLYRILDGMTLQSGDIDYCLPLVLPMVIDEIFGVSAMQKEMVEKGEVPTLKMEAKKKKGLDLLQLLCRYISPGKLGYIIEFLEKYLREHLVTEVNLGKYDQMLGSISAGLSANQLLLNSNHTPELLPALAQPVTKLRQQIKLLTWEDKARHENTVKKEWVRQKVGKQQILALQQEAGRNGSIFKRMSKEIGERRNQQIIASSLIQFYLTLLSLFIRKQVFTLASTTSTPDLANQILTLLGFLCECVDHRDNRLVAKSLKILHLALSWNIAELKGAKQPTGDKFKSLRKQSSRKILLLIEQLTLADEQLLKESFIFLNDLISQTSLNVEMLPNIVAIIKLHTPTTADQLHLAETYKLMRTILYKSPLHIYNALLDDLHKMVRMQVVTCFNKEIRDLCKNILAVYLRPKKALEPSIEAFNLSQKKQGAKANVTYDKRLQEELTFYLSNLQSTGQEAVLQLLEEFVDNREQSQIENYGELLVLGLMTARTNQIQNSTEHPIDKLVIKIIQKLDQNKVISLIEKSLLWMNQGRMVSISLCGSSLLRIIFQQSHLKFNKNFIEKYIFGNDGIFVLAAKIFERQVIEFETHKDIGEKNKKVDQQWNDILENMDIETAKYDCDPSVLELLLQLNLLLEKSEIVLHSSRFMAPIIVSLWKLLHSKVTPQVQLIINAIDKIQVLPALLSHVEEQQKPFKVDKHSFSFKKTIAELLFNQNKCELIQKLMKKLIEEETKLGHDNSILLDFSWLMVGLSLKAHMKPTIYQAVLPTILYLINNITLHKDLNGFDCRTLTLSQKNFEHKLLQLTVKLSSNTLIQHESRTLNQQMTQTLKEQMGVAEYFKAIGQYETKRRQKKEEEKSRVAELAILDPQGYIEERRGKMRKL